ncbi:MAG TPA: sulfatase [Caldilineaceae bacterium]|nr:sulfatase [Caldilineaceae bacterium]
MRAIMVMFDSLNRRMLSPYGCDWTHTPNFARLAERAVTFDNCYIGSMPCMPARRDLHTGRYSFLHRSWGPIEPFDDSMPEILRGHGVYTHLSTDHYHYFEDGGSTYHNRYTTWDFHRGQEGDPWIGQVAQPHIPETVAPRGEHPRWRQDWVNRPFMRREEEQPQPKTFAAGIDFIRRNAGQDNWFLQIETFDPHEPFFTQQHYKDLYPHKYNGRHFDWPPYRRVEETPEEVQHMRYEYSALLSMCDHYLGQILNLMDDLKLWDDTMLIVCTDHGFLLGEHDWWAKNNMPMWDEVAHTPFFIWDPRSRIRGERRSQLVQMIDVPATLLEFFGVARPPAMQGIPLGPVVADNAPTRQAALFGYHGGAVNITDGRYVYMRAAAGDNTPLYEYTLMPAHMAQLFSVAELQGWEMAGPFSFTKGCRVMKIPGRPQHISRTVHELGHLLYDLERDPAQETPLADAALEARLIELMVGLMQENEAPPEQYERLGLVAEQVSR